MIKFKLYNLECEPSKQNIYQLKNSARSCVIHATNMNQKKVRTVNETVTLISVVTDSWAIILNVKQKPTNYKSDLAIVIFPSTRHECSSGIV